MKFVLQPSLEHMALVKIAISLWNQKDVRALISKFNSDNLYSGKKWKTIEKRVGEKVPQLSLPPLLKEKVFGVINPIGLEISMWMGDNHEYLHVILSVDICWTSQGTVDQKRTAKVLVRDKNLDISSRYKLACMYCLEEDIIHLWNSMPEHLKKSVSYKSQLVSFWTLNMNRRGDHIDYVNEFDICAEKGDKVGAEYFLQKLTPWEKEVSLVETAKDVDDADTLCFLLSEMHEEQQMEIFKYSPYEVLDCFLRWPWQGFFIEVANCMWDFLSNDVYEEMLTDIIHKVRDGYKDYNYQKLFTEFWQKSPNALKSLITNELNERLLITFLCRIKDKENIRLILKDTTIRVKKKLIYSVIMSTFCKRSIHDHECDFLEFCIREFLPSKSEILKFKEVFENHKMPRAFKKHFRRNKKKWDQLFRFSDDSICKYDVSVEEGESSSSKRFCSIQ